MSLVDPSAPEPRPLGARFAEFGALPELGPPERWPPVLRNALGLILQSGFPMFLIWGPARILIYNDAYAPILGERRREALGRPFWSVWPEVRETIEPVIEAAFAGRPSFFEDLEVSLHRGGRPEPAWFTFSYSPVTTAEGDTPGVLCVCMETTAAHLERIARAQSDARLRFLDQLGRETSQLSGADDILAVTARLTGEHLGASICAYADMDDDEDGFTIRGDWSAPGSPTIVGRYSLASFGKMAVAQLTAGEPLVIDNNLEQIDPEEAATFQAIGITATVCMPLVRDGRLLALMAVHHKTPHVWTADELAVIREVTDRSWAHVERVGVQAELVATAAELGAITDAVPVLISYIDRDLRYRFVNRAYEEWFGEDRHALAGQHVADVLGAAAFAVAAPRLQRALAGERVTFESQMDYLRIGPRDVLVDYVPRVGADGEVLGLYAVVLDLTARAAAERALRQSEERFRRFSEATREGVVIHDTDTILDCNDAFARLLGYSDPAEVIGRTPADFVPATEAAALARRYETGDAQPYRMTLLRKDGSTFEAECVGLNGMWEGRPVRIGLAQDLTFLLQAEAAVLESETRLRLATEFADVGLWDVDELHQTLFWPPRVKAMFGISPEVEVSMQDFYDGVHPEDRDRVAAAYAAAADPARRALYDVEYRTVGKEDGVVRWVAAKGRGVFAPEGYCIRVIGTAVDITARKRIEEARDLLMREVDHRSRNALAIIQSVVRLTRSDDPEVFRRAVIGRVDAMARAQSALSQSQWQGGALRTIVEAELASVAPLERVRLRGPLVMLAADQVQPLSMIVHELATNATKYGALSVAAGQVDVSWSRTGAGWTLAWTEHGGAPVVPPSRVGFGSRLISRLAEQLGATVAVDWNPDGVRITLASAGDRAAEPR
ncbi:PAS domain S-box protein [Phenylobacterium sp. VNQ135]|uniref:PAS domain S-box protein n=1 Tax=Phenylobacterium sp. VNQ135 TaxID=3400922 RepID=UPI003C012F79